MGSLDMIQKKLLGEC